MTVEVDGEKAKPLRLRVKKQKLSEPERRVALAELRQG
jgi:hypothetical protein